MQRKSSKNRLTKECLKRIEKEIILNRITPIQQAPYFDNKKWLQRERAIKSIK